MCISLSYADDQLLMWVGLTNCSLPYPFLYRYHRFVSPEYGQKYGE